VRAAPGFDSRAARAGISGTRHVDVTRVYSAFTLVLRFADLKPVKTLVRLTVCLLLIGLSVVSTSAAYSSLYVFGDGACTTTNGPGTGPYYGKRYSNGRVWVEVLAQWQGLSYDSNKNWSFYGHYSSNMLINVNSFNAPADASTALFVVWACDADFVWNVNNYGTNITQWTNSINRSLTNHFRIITNLYSLKGARTLIMPNAVDLTKVPFYVNYAPASKAFIRQQTTNFNARLAIVLSNAVASLPGLKIYSPDIFALLDDVVANPGQYGLQKPNTYVIADLPPSQWALNGPGTNYVYWDDLDPTAKFHMWIAEAAQRLLSPVWISDIASLGASNQLTLVNVPIGRNGMIEKTTNFVNWTFAAGVNTNLANQSILVPVSGPQQSYRVRLPFAWTWP
jgi:GDSL-like lipase/acylhydrolase family protein